MIEVYGVISVNIDTKEIRYYNSIEGGTAGFNKSRSSASLMTSPQALSLCTLFATANRESHYYIIVSPPNIDKLKEL